MELRKLELNCTVVRPKSTEGVCDGLCACTSEGVQARAKRRVTLLRERFIVEIPRGVTRIAHAVEVRRRSQVNFEFQKPVHDSDKNIGVGLT
jgi:hypothetical protein